MFDLEKIAEEAFKDELEKIAIKLPELSNPKLLALGGFLSGAGLGIGASALSTKQVQKELKDPRLYSNLRGMLSFESAKKRVEAHKKLPPSNDSILYAIKKGLTRQSK